jgi:phage regulator Rha-like protein
MTGFGIRHYRTFDVTQEGFASLAGRFTGAKAFQFQLRYIEQFNTMEAELKAQAQPAAITATRRVASCLKDQSEITPYFRKSLRRETPINYHPL